MRPIPGWYRVFLKNIKNGVTEIQAAKMSLIGQDALIRAKRTDPEFLKSLRESQFSAKGKRG